MRRSAASPQVVSNKWFCNVNPLSRNAEQREFHQLYLQCSEHQKYELIGGTVYMASPLRWAHGRFHIELSLALGLYEGKTRGCELLDNVTLILGEESEPQPDLVLRILSESDWHEHRDSSQTTIR